MKKLLIMIVLFGLPSLALTGCGGSGETKVIDGGTAEPSMTTDQQAEYEEQMRSGTSGSGPGAGSGSGPGN